MPIILNLDVMLAKRKMRSNELAEKIGITTANLSILKTGKAKAVRFSTKEFMKKDIILLISGMALVIIGALLKINHFEYSKWVLILGLAIEAYVLASLVIKSLKK